MPALFIAAWLLGAPASGGTEPALAHASVSSVSPALGGMTRSRPAHALLERREDAAPSQGQCAALVEEICRRAAPALCERARREADLRPATEADQRACRALLDDPAQLGRLVRGLPSP